MGDEDLFGLDPATGALRWRFKPTSGRNPGLFLPAADDSTLVAGSSSGHVFSLDPETGTLRWQTKLVAEDTASVYEPVLEAGRIVVALTVFDGTGAGPDRGAVATLDRATGRLLWMRYLPATAGGGGVTATIQPAVLNGVVAVGARDGPVYGFALTSGDSLWTLPPAILPTGSPPVVRDIRPLTVSANAFIVGTTGRNLIAVSPLTGATRWTFAQGYGSTGWVRGVGNQVFVTYGGGQLEVVNGVTGALAWEVSDRIAAFSPGYGDSLIVVSGDGFHALKRH